MRTRFLGADNFGSVPIETLEFLRCPPPELPSTHFSNIQLLEHCFDDVSVLNIYIDIEKLPIEGALSKFFSDVLPHIIDVEFGGFTDDQSGTAGFDVRSSVSEHVVNIEASQKISEIFSGEKASLVDDLASETLQKDEKAFAVSGKTGFELVQFEVPEQNFDFFYQMENAQIFSESPRVANELDMPTLELRQQDFLDIQDSIYSVDNLFMEYFIEQKADLLEDSGFTTDKVGSPHSAFFLLEIDEASLGISNNISITDELIAFEDIETQKWMQEDELMSSEKEFLDFSEFDLLVYLSNHCLEIQRPELQVPCSDFFEEIDFIGDIEDSDIGKVLSFHPQLSDGISVTSSSIILYDEFQFIDLEQCGFSQVFCDAVTVGVVETLEDMFGEAMKFRSFDELIVAYELTLTDDSFKSLPVPILSNSQKIGSLHSFVEESLSELELESSSMFDGLYLDWHVLEEDSCSYDKHFPCWKMLEEIEKYNVNSSLNIFDNGMLVLNFVLSDGISDKPNSGESKEMLNVLLHGLSASPMSLSGLASGKPLNNDQNKTLNAEISSEIGDEISESLESLTQFNDLDFCLNPHDCAAGVHSKSSNLTPDSHKVYPVGSSDNMASHATTEVPLLQWSVKMYKIKLSGEILGLIDNFKRSFVAILENNKELVENQYLSQGLDDNSLLRLPKEKLMHQIREAGVTRTALARGDENIISLVALCAIKQMAWYLCYYGFHTTYLYIDKLTQSLPCLKCRLSFLQSLIENICVKAEKEIIEFHPSLSVVKELLQSDFRKRDKRLLIVAEQIFWWPLKRLLTSMKIDYDQPQNSQRNTDQQDECNEFSDATSIIFQSDCCLVSHEYITTSFPFEKFGVILEYGGSCELPRVLTILPQLDYCPLLYFLKVELEDLGAPNALCDGVDRPKKIRKTMKGDPHSILVHKVEELLNFMPVENYNRDQMDAVDGDEASFKMPEHCVSLAMESNIFHESKPSFPNIVIIVNTQNFEKEMVISRRSTYQKILAMEKEGAQVVERDLNLPVDILVNAAVCLAWYDLKNIGKKSSALDEAFSCLPLCIENIATSILTSLSFAFSSCILVFEGEKNFLVGVMESSDELYAAAASLGIDFQIFCSYSSEMTDEIILSCIQAANKQIRGQYPRMPESETLAESFLTAFPSVNPLSAQAILSSGVMLVEFLEWSCDRKIRAVQKYKIPGESVALLGLLSKYGEREDSKSAMTDSSSSVSYTPDMQNCYPKSNNGKTKRKWDENLQGMDMRANGSHIEPLKRYLDGRSTFLKAAGPNDFWMSENSEIIDECGKPALSTGNKYGQDEELEANMSNITSKVSPLYDFQIPEGYLTFDEKKRPKIHESGSHSDARERLDMAARNELNRHYSKDSGNQQEDFVGEVIDTVDTNTFGKDSSNADFVSFSPLKVEKGSTAGSSRTARKLCFGSSILPDFPTSAQIKSDLDSWFLLGDHQNSSCKGKIDHFDSNFNNAKVYQKQQNLREGVIQKTTSNSQDLPLLEKDNIQHGGTPLWNAIHNNGSPRESLWTIEFLNRIKEKSRLREQSLPLSAHCVGYLRSIPKATKRKSPSILEFYKYQGDGKGRRTIERKRQRRSVQPPCSSKNEKASALILPTWTPVDKRAKQTLSFATSGNGMQSKLIWSDKNSHTRSRRTGPQT